MPARSSSFVRRPGQHELTGVDHHDVVAHRLHVVEQVGGQHDRDAERRQAGDERQHLLAADRVQAGGRLVEQDQLRVGHERLGQLGPLPHARREALDRAEAGFVETDEIEHVRRPLAGGPRRKPADLTERGHHVGRRLVRWQAVVLGHEAQPGPHADRIIGHGPAADLDPSRWSGG